MDLSPIYELRNRLRTAMIAGTNLISEDFRLKRAVEEIKPLEALSPVFAKIGQLTDKLMSDNCEDREGTLIDTITLVDALLCTQGQVTVTGEIEEISVNSWGSVITNAPYSIVKELVEALTTSGNGHYQFVLDTHEDRPELFGDYRIKSAMVAALGAGYAELADKVALWLKEEGPEIVPLLQKDFDPKGKKDMMRRLMVMEAVAGGKCNDFYVQMLPFAERDVKNELIYALRHNVDNVELLLELTKKEKGNAKKMAYYALATFETERAEKLFREMYEKKPLEAMLYLRMSTTKWASKMVSECLMKQLALCKEPGYGTVDKVFTPDETELLRMAIEAIPGKNGPEICQAFRMAYEVDEIYYKHPDDDKIQAWEMHIPVRRLNLATEKKRFVTAIPYFLESAIRMNPDAELCALAEELYEKKSSVNKGEAYFSAALIAKLLRQEDCSEWLKEQIFTKGILGTKKNSSIELYLVSAIQEMAYDNKKDAYVFQTYFKDEANESVIIYEQQILTKDISGIFTDLLMEYSDFDVDRKIMYYMNTADKELCKKLEDYFYKKALAASGQKCRMYWKGLKKCGCERCEGLLVKFVQKSSELSWWQLCAALDEVPGNVEVFEKEAMEVHKLVADGKIKIQNLRQDVLLNYIESAKDKRR